MASALTRLRKARQGSGTSLASTTITSGTGGSALAKLRAARKNAEQTSITTPTASNTSTTGTSALARLRAARKTKLTPEAQIYASDEEKKRNAAEKDVGGLLGGVGYTLEKVGLGFLQGVEGVVDYAVGGLAELFGADDYSEDVIANDWLDYNHADSWYKPSEGWKFVGDVGSGIGTSLPGLLAGAAVTAATGGTGIGAGVGLALSGFSAAGTSTKEAYLESGELTGKQYGYGAIMGGIEAATEKLTGMLGTGLTKAVSSVSSALGKAASKTAASLTAKGVAKQLGKEFISEAFEEGAAEILSPVAKRLTYDKNAEFASADEVAYAALVGGLSGVVMGGAGMGTRSVRHIASGKKIGDSGKIKQTLELGQMYADIEADEATGSASIKAISEIMPKLAGVKDGDKLTVGQRRMLGELAEYTTVAPLENVMRKSAITAINAAEPIAAKLASDGNVKLVDGKLTYVTAETVESLTREGKEVRDITAEDITKGYDPEDPASILKSLQDNEVLRYVAASDASSRLILTANQLEDAALSGSTIRNQVDLNRFIEETNRSPERRAALGRELGISDNEWDTLQLGRFNEAIRAYRESGKADAYKAKAATVEKAKAIPETEAKKKIPSTIALGDGKIQRYKTDRVDIAVSRDGSSFIVYDYNSGDTSRSLTRKEVNAVLAEMKAAGEVNIPTDGSNTPENAENSTLKNQNKGNVGVNGEKSTKEKIAEVRERLDAKKIDEYLTENVKDYSDLGEANRSMIRKIVREGRTHGLDDADVLSYARVAARSGLNIEFDANMKDGEAGYFDPDKNRIVVNPKTTKKQELILIHELDHAIRAYIENDGKIHYLVYKDADKRLSEETRKMIKNEYSSQDVDVSPAELLADEASAYYSEAILGGKGFLDMLLGNEPTLQQKILSFFTGSAQSYSADPNLAKAARAHYRSFKKMFADFAERNKGRNAETAVEHGATLDKSVRRASNNITPKITVDMTDEERYEVLKHKKITAPFYKGEADALIAQRREALESKEKDFAKKAIVEIAEKLKIIRKEINFKNVEVKIFVSKSNLKESITKEATAEQIAKLLPVLDPVAENSVVIERHDNRYYFDTDTVYFDNLLGAYIDGDALVPVRFGLKHSITGATTLYVVVDQNKVALENLGETKNDRDRKDNSSDLTESEGLLSSVSYSISQIVPFVNSKDLLRYLPDDMLNENQRTAKWEAIAETIKYTNKKNDKKFAEYIAKGNLTAARQMISAKAKAEGYTVKVYHGTRAPGFTVFKSSEDGALGKGIYFAESKQYAEGISGGLKPYEVYLKIERPYEVKYPGGINQEKLIDQGYDGVHHEGNGFWVAFYPEQIKSADPVTYDDNGKVIPLSERFNPKNSDIRYSMDITPEVDSPTIENVNKSRFTEPDVKLKDKIKVGFTSYKDKVYIEAVDELWGIEKYLKKYGGRKDAEAFVQQVRSAETIAQTMIGVAQYDITDPSGKRLGDGITKIFKKYHVRNLTEDFNDYLLHQLNVDRMTLHERSLAKQDELKSAYDEAQAAYDAMKKRVEEGKLKHVPRSVGKALTAARKAYEGYEVLENKPVFGENEKRAEAITADESLAIIAKYEAKHPEFKESAEQVWAYSKNLMNMRVSAGLISKESAELMEWYYPHYVPSFRDTNKGSGAGVVKNESQLAVNSTVKRAKGGGEDVYDIEESIAVQTRQVIKAIRMNQLANAVYDAAKQSGDTSYVIAEEISEQSENNDPDTDVDIDLIPKNNQIVFFKNGKKIDMVVADELFAGFKGVNEGSVGDRVLFKAASKVLGAFKNLVTQYSPAFAVRNFVRDMQDAFINTKHPKLFASSIKSALEGMVNNDADWQKYLAYGGFASTVFDAKGFTNGVGERGFEAFKQISGIDENDFKKMGAALKNVLTAVGNANAFIEQLTRFTEFKASLAAGDSIEVAINNSAEVTTNFSRHGSVVKKLNATFIPFLNASVQGFDKLLRVISGPLKEKSLAALAILFAKIFAIGITPQIINMIMNGDDEDYENLTNEVKENYFLIKVGDQFIKIPRGRAAAAFGGIANRLGNVARGDDFDLAGYVESLASNVTPLDSFTRDIFSPLRDVASNTTWYGGEIEGRQFENIRPGQRYDESTSSIAIAIGGAINFSPKKIHYLLDQYSGVIGDFLLPATSKKAEKDYLSGNFLLDPKMNNKLSNDFYKLYDEAQYSKNEGNVTAYYQLKHLNDIKQSVSELYDEITKIQQSDISDVEKLQQTRTIRVLINNLYKTAKADYGAYTQAIKATEGMFDESDATQQRLRHVAITKMMYGSEKALEEYNSAVYETASLVSKAGVSYDLYYNYYFSTRGIESDVDRKGEVIPGSKKEKTLKAIKTLDASPAERLLLIALAGYSLSETEQRKVLSLIMRMDGTKEDRAALAEKCGFKVKNGRISLK